MTVLDDQILSVGLKADDDGEQRLDIRREICVAFDTPSGGTRKGSDEFRDLLKSYGLRLRPLIL